MPKDINTTIYKQNPLGIYVYPSDTIHINNIHWKVDSICNDIILNKSKKNIISSFYIRIIKDNKYGISLKITNKNV